MTSKHPKVGHRCQPTYSLSARRPLLVAMLLLASGCATSLPLEPPICLPLRPVLVDLSVQEQLEIRDKVGKESLLTIATNDASLKSHVRLLEGLIVVHDIPLGDCD